jgi:ATP-binding cassette subfamily B protein/subfamily B ATP-binding cassette protein MsbA
VTWDTSAVQTLFNGALVPAVTATLTLLGIGAILLRLDTVLTLCALSVAVPLMLLIRRLDQPISDRATQAQERESAISTRVQETLSGIRAVQAFGAEEREVQRFQTGAAESLRANLALTVLQAGAQSAIGLLFAAGTTLVVGVVAWRAIEGRVTAGDVVLVTAYIGMLYGPLQTLAYTAATVQGAAAGARRTLTLLDTEPDVADAPDALPLEERARGHIAFDHVSFGYRRDQTVLQDVTLDIPSGRTVALVGASGAGKTTIASLLLRFYDPTAGRITLDGQDLRTLTLASLRRNVALVPQEPFLFSASIRENIAYGRPDATEEEILAAARDAGAHAFIEALPTGYDAVLGERGATLSGGQRQRLSIARAFLKDAPVLILDEPTASLDAETEAQILRSLQDLTRDRTTVIIAHRLSTIRRADIIVVLDSGRIVEQGDYETLMRLSGAFRRLHDLQFDTPPSPGAAR